MGERLPHHLAAVADAQTESVRSGEERGKLLGQFLVKENGLGPAFPGTEHIAVGEAAHGQQTGEVFQVGTPGNQVAHVHVNGGKARLMHHESRFHMGVHALLAQDGHARANAFGDVRCGNVFLRIEGHFWRHARIIQIENAVVFHVGAGRIVAQTRNAPAGLAPPAMQRGARLAVNDLAVVRERDRLALA